MTDFPYRRFTDQWRGKSAECFLFGEGSGPENEAVRIICKPAETHLTVFYIRSYDERQGNAQKAYETLKRLFGPIEVQEVRSEEGKAFHRLMLDRELIASIDP